MSSRKRQSCQLVTQKERRMTMRKIAMFFASMTTASFLILAMVMASATAFSMKRPLLARIASGVFDLEQKRVEASSVEDEQGRMGEPMEWSNKSSVANQFSEVVASNPIGYQFKQFVADLVAGDFDQAEMERVIDDFVENNKIAVFSFTSCPFCRRAKDFLSDRGIEYTAMELDDHPFGNQIRAVLGKRTKRTSMPAIFINSQFIGGCNDGPGLIPLAQAGQLDKLLSKD